MKCETSSIYYRYVLDNFILLFSAYILVNDKINRFLKDRMRWFFMHSWFDSLVLTIRWRWKKSEYKLLESSGWCVKIKLYMREYYIILREMCNGKTTVVSFVIQPCRMLTIGVKVKILSINSGITAIFCIKLLVTLKFVSDWRQVDVFSRVLKFSNPLKLTATIQRKYCSKWR